MHPSGVRRLLLPAAAALFASGLAAQAPGGNPLPPLPDTLRHRVLSEVKAPPGFAVSVFAAPPQLVYPACVEAAPTGEVFACVEPNLNFDRAKGRGRIVRLVDRDGDGTADEYTVFADSLDSVRGLVYDAGTLYVMHSPTLSAMRDTDGDGVADRREVLVQGLGFGLDDRGGDHTSNGLTLGVDGWLYLAVGDYGFLNATGRDGRRLRLRGGGVVRVRPDGTELEIVARGTRNIYDVALDPFLTLFARDNNNNGQGWGVRLHTLPPGSDAGYPSLFRDFAEETLAPLADYGAGAGTGALWLQDPAFPAELDNTLYTADWGLNQVFRHRLRPQGASYAVDQEAFLSIPRPSDLASDGNGNLYVASLSGGSFNYAGEHVGYVVRLRPSGSPTAVLPAPSRMTESQLVELLAGPSSARRLAAQREILRRGRKGTIQRRLERLILDARAPDHARVAGLFTLKQLLGPGSHATILRATGDPKLRGVALRALADRVGEAADLPVSVFLGALADPDPKVRLQAIDGLRRVGARSAADRLFAAAADEDAVVSHVAINALVELQAEAAALAALDGGQERMAPLALRVLQRRHTPEVVAALIERVEAAADPARRTALLQALARLYHREGAWDGRWWDVQPSTEGPYYRPETWSESERIRPVLERALLVADGQELTGLAHDFIRRQVLPVGADSLLGVLGGTAHPARGEAVHLLVGGREVSAEAIDLLTRLAAESRPFAAASVRLLAAQGATAESSVRVLRDAALDAGLPAEQRVQALDALGRLPGSRGVTVPADVLARLSPDGGPDAALEVAWRRVASDRRNAGEADYFIESTRSPEAGTRVLGYAALVHIARTGRNAPAIRARASSVIESAWADRVAAPSLARAVVLMNAQELYATKLRAFQAARPGE